MRGRNGGSNSRGRSQIPAAILFNSQGSEHAAPIGPRVDPNPVVPLLDIEADGMTMDHDEAMPGFVR